MKKWRKVILFFGLITLIILGSSFQFFWYMVKTPAGSIFPLIHNSVGDYYYYLSFIQQGMEGKFFAISRYTSELFPGKPLFLFFTAVGFLGGLLKLDATMVYTISRFVLSFLFLGAVFFLITRLFFGTQRWLAFLFIFCTTPVWYQTPQLLRQVGDFWSGIDPLMRIVFLPHHLFGNTAFILSLILLDAGLKQRSIRIGLFSGIFAFFSWLSNIALFPIFISIVCVFFLTHVSFIRDPKIRAIAAITGFFVFLEFLIYVFSFSSSTFPWGYVAAWERTQQYPLDVFQFFLMLGPLSVVAVGGFIIAWKKSYLWQFIVLWFCIPFVFLLFQQYLPFSNVRFVQAVPYIPTGLLACLAGIHILKNKFFHGLRWLKIIVVGIVVLYAIPSYIASIQNQMFCFSNNIHDPLFYVSHDSADITQHLNTVGSPDDVVLAPDPLPSMIPAFSNKRVVYGMPLYTVNFAEKQKLGYEFFGGRFDTQHVDFLSKERVRFIIFQKNNLFFDPFLQSINCTKIYENATYFFCGRSM